MVKRNIHNWTKAIRQIIIAFFIVLLINWAGSFYFTRWDWSSEKRYTLSEETKNILNAVSDDIYFKIYLEGNFPAGFMRLRQKTREMLDEYAAYNKHIHYRFINPNAAKDAGTRNQIYQELIKKGLEQTNLQVKTKEGITQQLIFPGAIVSYQSKEISLNLLKTQIGVPPEAVLNNSIQSLEFGITSTIKKLLSINKPRIAFLKGQEELGHEYLADISNSLSADYSLNEIELSGNPETLFELISGDSVVLKYALLIVAKPEKPFSETDKFLIDQYIMRGGKVLWLIDPVLASMDSLRNNQSAMAITKYLNLEDQLFTYGVRLNNNLIMDMNARQIPIKTGQVGAQPKINFFPWYFFPVISPRSNHPIVKNLNAISTEFVSSIDTIPLSGITKTILLRSSNYSNLINTPAILSFDILKSEPDPRFFNQGPQNIAVLLEGEFQSVFNNRYSPLANKYPGLKKLSKSFPTQMIVISDGDMIKNQLENTGSYPLPLGYDQYTGQTFGNKDFILNSINYLTDGKGLIALRGRDLKLRLLDKEKITSNRIYWQLFNGLAPVILIILFGIIIQYIRYKKYLKTD